MVRASGSYPEGHKFESHRRYHAYNTEFSFNIWPVGQAVKTPPFHGGNMGSSPVRVTSKNLKRMQFALGFLLFGNTYGNGEEHVGSREEKTLFSTTLSEGPL